MVGHRDLDASQKESVEEGAGVTWAMVGMWTLS